MPNCNRQSKLVRETLQANSPCPESLSVATSTVAFEGQTSRTVVLVSTDRHPPRTNCSYDECRCFTRDPHDHIARVACDVVDAKGNGSSVCPTRKVVIEHVTSMTTPSGSRVFEIAQQLLFLAIDADYRPFITLKTISSSCQQSELLVAIRIVRFRQSLAIRAQRVLLLTQQPSDCHMSDFYTSSIQCSRKVASCFVCPTEPAHRIARRRVFEQLVQQVFDARAFFSIVVRPPPARRIRSKSAACALWHSRSPRRMVTRVRPVISSTCCIPPRPICLANKPANSRRLRSSRFTITRLIDRWCSATSGLRRDLHMRQVQRWIRFRLRSAMIEIPIHG